MSIVIPNKTIQIQSKGSARLSPDLAEILGESYAYEIDRDKKRIILNGGVARGLRRMRVWGSNRRKSKSGYIGIGSLLKELKLDPEKLQGKVYDVEVEGKQLVVEFAE